MRTDFNAIQPTENGRSMQSRRTSPVHGRQVGHPFRMTSGPVPKSDQNYSFFFLVSLICTPLNYKRFGFSRCATFVYLDITEYLSMIKIIVFKKPKHL